LTDRNIRYDVGAGEALNLPDNSFDVVVCVDVLEHVSDVQRVLAEVARVLRPGGLLLFDTINRNGFATFVAVTLAERILRLLPPGTHDPALFIRPSELRKTLASVGFTVGGIAGLGPRGMNRRGDPIFGRVPGTAALYIGSARNRGEI
jgi:2-polyprenyl-6-hydroxyphenyl methylase/3-demethylubiquinone-9 3-methyltransferase